MIPVHKEFNKIPNYLLGKSADKAFGENIQLKRYEKGDYRHQDIKGKLKGIYHNKCAFCESDLNSQYGQVEHYRPKKVYYWMSLSWSNLLLACEICNGKKSDKFEINGIKAVYKNETLSNIHSKTADYDQLEKPLLINPEQETEESLREHFTFDLKKGEIIHKTNRMEYTVETCDLNRKNLIQSRMTVLNDLKNLINEFIYKNYPNISEILFDIYGEEKKKAVPEREFTAWRKEICAKFADIVKESLISP